MTHYHFCTYFDRHYCDKGLALYESIVKHTPSFTLYILCLDDDTYTILKTLGLSSVVLIRLSELEERNPSFHETKENRSLIEYYFTCTPVFIRDVIEIFLDIDIITYLDADLYFFSSIDPVYEEMGSSSIMIIEHRFPLELQKLLRYGRFNVGYLSFRNDTEGKVCLDEWGKNCIKWCYDRIEDDKYADQKYLDKWVTDYPGLIISQNIGLNAAPWNISQYNVKKFPDGIILNNHYLTIFHFHHLKKEFEHPFCQAYDMNICGYLYPTLDVQKIIQEFYYLYILHLVNCQEKIRKIVCMPIEFRSLRKKSFHEINSSSSIFILLVRFLKKIRKEGRFEDKILIFTLKNVFIKFPLIRFAKIFMIQSKKNEGY